jgi:hypothetical protein
MGIEVPAQSGPRFFSPRRTVLGIAAALVALGGAFGIGLSIDRSPAPVANAVAPVARLFESDLTSASHYRGELYLAEGKPGWVFMTIDGTGTTGYVTCQLETANGRYITIGKFWLAAGSANWASPLTIPAGEVRLASVVSSDGTVLASAAVHA